MAQTRDADDAGTGVRDMAICWLERQFDAVEAWPVPRDRSSRNPDVATTYSRCVDNRIDGRRSQAPAEVPSCTARDRRLSRASDLHNTTKPLPSR